MYAQSMLKSYPNQAQGRVLTSHFPHPAKVRVQWAEKFHMPKHAQNERHLLSHFFFYFYISCFCGKTKILIRFLLKPQKIIDLRLALPMQRGLISNQAWKLQIRVVTPQQNIYESCFWIKRQAGFCTRARQRLH